MVLAELSEINKKVFSLVVIENLLDDTALSAAFPTISRLLKVCDNKFSRSYC